MGLVWAFLVSPTTPPLATVLRAFLPSIYLPVFLTMTATAMVTNVFIPLYGDEAGLSDSAIGVVVAAAGLGGLLSQLSIGTLVARHSARTIIVAALFTMALATIPVSATSNPGALALLRMAWGVGSTGFLIGMQTRLTRATSTAQRGRAMATFGVNVRAATLVGPLLAGFLLGRANFAVGFSVATLLYLLASLPVRLASPLAVPSKLGETKGTVEAVREHVPLLLTAGSAHLCVIAARVGRGLILPLIGLANGLDAAAIGILVAVSAGADLLLAPVSGHLMDRYGRLYAIVPAFIGFGVGMIALGFATTDRQVMAAAIVIGAFNGIGSGTMLTLSSDLAPPEATSQFLSAVGTIRDTGRIVGPIVVGTMADVAGLRYSAFALAGLMFCGLAIIVFRLGETSKHPHAREFEAN